MCQDQVTTYNITPVSGVLYNAMCHFRRGRGRVTRGKQGPGSASSQDGDSDYSSYDGEEGEGEGVMVDTAFSDTSSSVSGALPRLLII